MFPRPHRFISSFSSPIAFATVLAVFCFFVAANADSTDLSREQGLRGSFGHSLGFLLGVLGVQIIQLAEFTRDL